MDGGELFNYSLLLGQKLSDSPTPKSMQHSISLVQARLEDLTKFLTPFDTLAPAVLETAGTCGLAARCASGGGPNEAHLQLLVYQRGEEDVMQQCCEGVHGSLLQAY